jgi:hypothetical protein
MKEDSLNRTFLGPKGGIRLNKKDSCNEKKSRTITRKVSHPITLSKVPHCPIFKPTGHNYTQVSRTLSWTMEAATTLLS